MSHVYISLFYHIVWSTKKRYPLITKSIEKDLYTNMKLTINNQKVHLFAIGGTYDHVHILIKMYQKQSIPELVKKVKSNSSRFINATSDSLNYFAWQEGYSVFSVSRSVVPTIKKYIENQKEHHEVHNLDEELKILYDL